MNELFWNIEIEYVGKWRHVKTGKIYEVKHLTNLRADKERKEEYPTTIVYVDEEGNVWSRPLVKWDESFVKL